MLAGVDGDHLARHPRCGDKPRDGVGDLFDADGPAERRHRDFGVERCLPLVLVRQDGTGSDGVHPHARGESLRHRGRGGQQAGF